MTSFDTSSILDFASISFILAALLIFNVIRNVFFHPLASFPGPLIAAVTDCYHTYLFSTRRYHLRVEELHRRYGKAD